MKLYLCPVCGKKLANDKAFRMHCRDKGGARHLQAELLEPRVLDKPEPEPETNETTEMWREHHAAQATKRASNREASTRLLRESGVPFVSKNNGAHLIVADAVDYWPGTGLWHSRTTPTQGRGVMRLLKFLHSNSTILSETPAP